METTSLSGGDRQQHHPHWWPKQVRRWRFHHRGVCEEWDETWNLGWGTIRPEERWPVDLRSKLSGGICHDGECNSSKGGQVEAPYHSMSQLLSLPGTTLKATSSTLYLTFYKQEFSPPARHSHLQMEKRFFGSFLFIGPSRADYNITLLGPN